MIRSADVLASYSFIARRFNWPSDAFDKDALQAALAEARGLTTEERDEPAALFFALARQPAAFPFGWRVMAHVVAAACARDLGLDLQGDTGTFDSLCIKVESGDLTFAGLREWFAKQMKPIR